MSNNITGLPAEVVEEIKLKAEDCANRHINGRANRKLWETVFNANKAGATEYATKLHEAQKELKDYSGIIDRMEKEGTEMKRLLHEVFMKHESGLLPDRFVYDKIKLFLYGE